jgi:hypothetical protein
VLLGCEPDGSGTPTWADCKVMRHKKTAGGRLLDSPAVGGQGRGDDYVPSRLRRLLVLLVQTICVGLLRRFLPR